MGTKKYPKCSWLEHKMRLVAAQSEDLQTVVDVVKDLNECKSKCTSLLEKYFTLYCVVVAGFILLKNSNSELSLFGIKLLDNSLVDYFFPIASQFFLTICVYCGLRIDIAKKSKKYLYKYRIRELFDGNVADIVDGSLFFESIKHDHFSLKLFNVIKCILLALVYVVLMTVAYYAPLVVMWTPVMDLNSFESLISFLSFISLLLLQLILYVTWAFYVHVKVKPA